MDTVTVAGVVVFDTDVLIDYGRAEAKAMAVLEAARAAATATDAAR